MSEGGRGKWKGKRRWVSAEGPGEGRCDGREISTWRACRVPGSLMAGPRIHRWAGEMSLRRQQVSQACWEGSGQWGAEESRGGERCPWKVVQVFAEGIGNGGLDKRLSPGNEEERICCIQDRRTRTWSQITCEELWVTVTVRSLWFWTHAGYEEATWRKEIEPPGGHTPGTRQGGKGSVTWWVGPAQVVCQLGKALVFLPTRGRVEQLLAEWSIAVGRKDV